ncbi:hypothetical protein [Enterobacter roggenkampii]|uniref:hypothetical protein n=1 Tax=Enterobacter roggenkampii TaxID=1812935 RepID=UPI00075199B0|nr:hypothetical protein [Enterobacter roggenkampii]KUR09570.1 hypothetical protein AWI34_15650 [Enterobacter roggenkampii]MCK7367626.1 hypothetical protein [Enterobacter roggenkampii]
MPGCLVFRNDGPVIDLKMKVESPVFYFANISTGEKQGYPVHEYVCVDPDTKEKYIYQIAYDQKPSDQEIEKAITELKPIPISKF